MSFASPRLQSLSPPKTCFTVPCPVHIVANHPRRTQGATLLAPERVAFRKLLEYQRGRKRLGSTTFRALTLRREAHLLSLDGDEFLIIVLFDGGLTHWEATRDSFDSVRHRALELLCRPGAP